MCGLAGLARLDGRPLGEESGRVLADMAHSLSHRGPDDTKLLLDGPVGLGFTRLSIVDPVGGDQPLSTEDGSVVLIANGEIYNHRELEAGLPAGTRMKTDSDCEVLVHLYRRDGIRFLDRVRGIYALVLWDRVRGRIVFARDRFGVKPLHFARNGDRLAFASELKALFADPSVPRRLDWEACLTDQMTMGAARLEGGPPTAWFEDVEIVPAGTIVSFDLRDGTRREHRYWSLPAFDGGEPVAPDELARRYGELLADSVSESCMSDAEIGLFLSGGIDSAAVAAFAGELGTLHTFTALNGGTLMNGDGEYAHRVAEALGRPNHQVVFDPERVPEHEEWKRLLWQLETPLCGPEQFYKYELHRFARLTRPNLKVMLLGQASDEFNGGYTVELANDGGWDGFLETLRDMNRAQSLLRAPRLAAWWAHEVPLLRDEALLACRDAVLADPYEAYVAWRYRQIQQYNCWHEDRTAAGHGIEARPPFLDHRIVELTATIPLSERRRLLWDKQILREALQGILPDDLIDRPKVGFFYGAGVRHVYRTFVRMLARDGDALLEEALSAPRTHELVDLEAARATLRRLERNPDSTQLEALLHVANLGLLEQFALDLPAPPIEWPARPLPRELEHEEWDAETIAAEVLPSIALELDAVPTFAEGVLLVRPEPEDGTWFLVVGGSLEYVVDEDENPAWLRFLRAVDGTRDLGELLDSIGCEPDALRPLLAEAVDVGVLELTVPALRPVAS